MEKYQLKSPWAKISTGAVFTFLPLLFIVQAQRAFSFLIVVFVVGTLLISLGLADIILGKDNVARKMNQLKPIDLWIYTCLYMTGLAGLLLAIDYFFPTGWQLLLLIMLFLCFSIACIGLVIKKIRNAQGFRKP